MNQRDVLSVVKFVQQLQHLMDTSLRAYKPFHNFKLSLLCLFCSASFLFSAIAHGAMKG
jgi:hypothetical protein